MKFSGDIDGKHSFINIEAACPNDLLVLLDPAMKLFKLRCWILLQNASSGEPRWSEIFLDWQDHFQSILPFVGHRDNIQLRFRSSQISSNAQGTTTIPDIHEDLTDLTLEESFSSESQKVCNEFVCQQLGNAINLEDPISGKHIHALHDPFCITFYPKRFQSCGSKTLCVSKSGLEAMVARTLNEGRDIFRLSIVRDLECSDGKRRSFSLTPVVWVESLLPQSPSLGALFQKANEISLQRKHQLQCLEQDHDLWRRVHYWISDLLSSKRAAKERLRYGQEGGTSFDDRQALLSSFFFCKVERRNLGRILMPNGVSLCNLLKRSVAEDDDTSHFGLHVCQGLNIETRFRFDEAFNHRKKQWIKLREEALRQFEI